ncbi:phage integrase family protein [Roseateles sp. BYS78W]|uniref:Phage integrase family protein n=1 Tax=Pelomonas candidula TaxID=3299025 RepID=A0ABW7HEI4_9BURK
MRDDRVLGLHHFAFLRAGLHGLDLQAAFVRYLAWCDSTTDLRHATHRHAALLAIVRSACGQLASTLPSGHPAHQALADLQFNMRPAARTLPSLDEWAASEGLDRDFYSEEELLAEYRAAHGLDNLDAARAAEEAGWQDRAGRAVKALNLAEALLARRPSVHDSVDAWLDRTVARRLRAAGLATLSDLVLRINTRGRRWWRRSGVGERRGDRIVQWLLAQRDALDVDLRPHSISPAVQGEVTSVRHEVTGHAYEIIMPRQFGLLPLEQLAVPRELSGASGVFRSHGPNTLGASNDLEAVEAWLQRFGERSATLRSYRKESERFLLWCLLEVGKPLSSVTSPDCQAFRTFLAAVPAKWVNVMPVSRSDAMWRPFRGQLSPASQRQALVIVQALYEGLVAAGYLVANPMRSVLKASALPAVRMQVQQRSFTAAEVQHLRMSVELEADGPHRRRLRALVELLLACGIRLDELAQATHSDLRQVEVDGESSSAWVLTVVGKRRKAREVPVPDDVVAWLEAHALDLPAATTARPLVAALEPAPGGAGVSGRALTPSGLYALLKRFLGRCSATAAARGLDDEHVAAASTHWLRHTFGRRAAVAGVPVEVICQAMGHASLTTTSIYLTQERSRMIRELRRIPNQG